MIDDFIGDAEKVHNEKWNKDKVIPLTKSQIIKALEACDSKYNIDKDEFLRRLGFSGEEIPTA